MTTDDTVPGNGEWNASKRDVYHRIARMERLMEGLDERKADMSDIYELKTAVKELSGAVRSLERITDKLDWRSGLFGTIGGLVIMLITAAIGYLKP